MRFKTDENLHPELDLFLREEGHDALTVWDEGLRGRPDTDLAVVCQLERRALVTLDLGFADIRAYPPHQFAGLIVLRLVDQSRRSVLAVFPRVVSLLKSEPLIGRLWIVDEHRVRIREETK
jgi:predicted nuclease of predicted toxin-antitoxin system